MSKLWPVYYVSGMQIYLLSTRQILQFGLRVKDDKSSFTFCNKSGDTVLLATSNSWDNIQIVKTHIEDVKKIHFPIQKYVCHSCTLEKMYQCSFSENSVHSSKPLELIHSDLLKLSILSYSKYKQVITFLDDYSFHCNIAFLHKKSEVAEVIMSIFQIWLNTTFYTVKRLHTDNEREYIILSKR